MQRSENYKTLIFSEMSIEDQERIMELMVNNNVEFEQSQDGNYFATIRLIHRPQKEFDTSERTLKKHKSKSPDRKKSPAEQKYYEEYGDGRYENKMRELENYDRPLTARARLTNAKPVPVPAKNRSPFQKAAQRRKEGEGGESFNAGRTVTEYDRLNRAMLPVKKQLVQNEKEFEALVDLLNLPSGLRAKRMNVGALIKITEEIYSACFSKNSSTFKQNLSMESDPQIPKTRFPRFVYDWLQSKHKHRKLFEQNAADLLASVDFHRHESHEVQTFALFLSEQYDASDLIFFLYVRFLSERELNTQFASPQFGKKSDVDIRQVLMPSKTALKVAKIFFDEDQQLLKNFMSSLDEHYIQQAQKGKEDQFKQLIPVSIFLGLILQQFHRQKKTQQQIDINEEVRGFAEEERSHEDEALAQHLLEQQHQQQEQHRRSQQGTAQGRASYTMSQQGMIQEEMEDAMSGRMGAHSAVSQPRQTPPAHMMMRGSVSNAQKRKDSSASSQSAKISEELLLLKDTIFRHIQMKKVKGLVNQMLNIYSNLPHELLQEIGENLYNMLLKKVDDLLDALFRNDKMRWLACLMIEDDPDDEQLNYIENLQMLVRQLQHSAKESIPYNEVDKLSVLILETPELQRELKKLVAQMVASLSQQE